MPSPRITSLHVYPVKSCGGMTVQEARLGPRGLEGDREWMLVDPSGTFVTQRTTPRMALIRTDLASGSLCLQAPRMPPLEISAALPSTPPAQRMRYVEIWGKSWEAIDEGDDAAAWFTDFLARPLRLVRFAPEQRRLSPQEWTRGIEAENAFSDGYPILVLSQASVDNLSSLLGGDPLPINRFRPNLVLGGVPPHFEDQIRTLGTSSVELVLVKPCTRCRITATDQATSEVGDEPLRTLSTYRRDDRFSGVTFGQNAVILRGHGETLRVGMKLHAVGPPSPL